MKKIFKFKLRNRHKRILALIKENQFRLLLAMGLMLLVGAATGAVAFMIKPILDEIFFKQDRRMLTIIPLTVVVIYFIKGTAEYGHSYLMNYVGQNVIKKLRDQLYANISDLPLSFFYRENTGRLMSRVTNDVSIVKGMVSTAVTGALRDCFTIVSLTFVIFYRDWQLASYALLILPLAFYPIYLFGQRVRKVSTGCQECIADLNSFLHETFSGNKIVKAFGMENYEKKRFYSKTKSLFKIEMSQVVAKSLSSPVMEFLGGVGIGFIIWYGGYRVMNGISTVGTFFSFMAGVLMLYEPVKKLAKLNNNIQEGLAAADRIFDIIEYEPDIKEVKEPVHMQRRPHSVRFENVYFRYEDDWVLKDINLKADSGEIIALVGMSGGGKTSLVNLIPRFYDVTEGKISIDGIDIRKLSISSLRDQIAIVTQEPILFNDTIRNNIAYGNRNASEEDIFQAAKAAYAYDFIMGFPKGFDTTIGELGSRLSGGEKQRICISRALLKDAPVLILDEATSALDAESEMLVQKALENLMKGRTTFVIAHRLSTIAYAHRIIVLVNGKIVEEGQHHELIQKQGEYYKLAKIQLKN
jgi:ATP-binding cassette, subfamily B, bacterial MsbA